MVSNSQSVLGLCGVTHDSKTVGLGLLKGFQLSVCGTLLAWIAVSAYGWFAHRSISQPAS